MTAAHYDPELPFLADLEKHIRARAEQAEQTRARTAQQTGHLLAMSPLAIRMTRRVPILAGLLLFLAATALGARSLFFNSDHRNPLSNRQGASVLVAHALEGGDSWALRLYTRNGQLCRALIVSAQAESSRCASPPRTTQISVSSLQSAQHGYVFGVAGVRVSAVRVSTRQAGVTVATHAVAPAQALAAGLPKSTRFYLAILTRPSSSEDPPATVTALGPKHRLIGHAHIACLQEAGPPPCGP